MPQPRHGGALDAADLRACGELLTDLHRASRVASNALVLRVLQRRGSSIVDPEFVECLRTIVAEVLDELPARQRTIVERCDFGNETRDAVAAELAISHRHFSRERREAHRRIAERLLDADTRQSPAEVTVSGDLFEHQLRMSRVLENNGRWHEGASLLEGMARLTDSPERRIAIELRLSRLYYESDRLTLSEHHAEIARALSTRLEPSQRWRSFETNVAFARILSFGGESSQAAAILHRSIAQLRSWAHRANDVQAVLADALCLRAILHGDRNELQQAVQTIGDACAIARSIPHVEPQLALTTRWHAAVIRLLQARDRTTIREELFSCYRDATMQGLTRDALLAAVWISQCNRLDGHAERSVELLAPLTETARSIGHCEVMRHVFSELAAVHVEIGDFEAALCYLHEMEQQTVVDPGGLGTTKLLAARIYAGLGDYSAALSSAESAELIFTRLGLKRCVGPALIYQGAALVALGRYEQARRILPIAIELEGTTNQPTRLATAYDLMAKASGEPKYTVQARKLRLR